MPVCLVATVMLSCRDVTLRRAAIVGAAKAARAVVAEWLRARCEVCEEAIHSTRDTLVEP